MLGILKIRKEILWQEGGYHTQFLAKYGLKEASRMGDRDYAVKEELGSAALFRSLQRTENNQKSLKGPESFWGALADCNPVI